jgi:hypothetical protein
MMKMKKVLTAVPFLLLASQLYTPAPAASPRQTDTAGVYNVRAFGAKGDGKALDSPAINRAIDAAHAAGGGTVRFPSGTYRSFSIHLKSNVSLRLASGSVILAADPRDGDGRYDPPEPNQWDKYQDFGHSHWHNSLIWGEGVENVSIEGPGMIWGRGLVRSGTQSRTDAQNKALGTQNPEATPFGYPNARDRGGGTLAQAALEPPEKEDAYPEPSMFGEMPAYGFFIRHVRGLEMRDVQVTFLNEDLRPAFVLNDVRGADFRSLKARLAPGASTFVLKNVEDFGLQQSRPLPDTFLERAPLKKL